MSGAVIENLSNRKLCTILLLLFLAQIAFFLVGGLVSPAPSSSETYSMTLCKDAAEGRDKEKWFYIRPNVNSQGCNIIDHDQPNAIEGMNGRELVWVAQMPHARDSQQLEYSPLFQSFLGILMINFDYDTRLAPLPPKLTITMDVQMAYRKTSDGVTEWRPYVNSKVVRELNCVLTNPEPGNKYECDEVDLFELGSSDWPFYLLNIRVPPCPTPHLVNATAPNCEINAMIADIDLVTIYQNGGFTIVWLSLKTLVTPFLVMATMWYWRRVQALPRKPVLLEKAIMALAVTMVFLDVPIEWIGLFVRTPFMLLLSDIRQGLFYCMLFTFWLIFTGEHLMEDSAKNKLSTYYVHLSCVILSCGLMFLFDLAERGAHLSDPFSSIWATKSGMKMAYTFILLACIAMGLYFVFLVYKVIRVMLTIKRRRRALQSMTQNRRIKFEGIIYRFRFLMVLTISCAALTLGGLIMEQVGEGQMHWGDHEDAWQINTTSAFLTGTFGLWNMYVLLLLSMYAPSHKHYRNAIRVSVDGTLADEGEEEEDYLFANTWDDQPTESAALTTFVRPNVD